MSMKPLVVSLVMLLLSTCGCTETGMGRSATDVNGVIHQGVDIPATARDINYYSTPIFSIVEAEISESEFLRWCEAKGWEAMPIADGDIIPYLGLNA